MAGVQAEYIHEELQDLGLDDFLSEGEEDSEDQVLYENDQRRTILSFLQDDQRSTPAWKKNASQPPPDSDEVGAGRFSSQKRDLGARSAKQVSQGWRNSSQALSGRQQDSLQDVGTTFAFDNFAASFDNPAEWEDGPPPVPGPPDSETAALDSLFHFSASLAEETGAEPPAADSQPQPPRPPTSHRSQPPVQEMESPSSEQGLKPPEDSIPFHSISPPEDSFIPPSSLPSPSLPIETFKSADGPSQSQGPRSLSQKLNPSPSESPSVLHQMLSLSQKLRPPPQPTASPSVDSPGSSYRPGPHSHSQYTTQTPTRPQEDDNELVEEAGGRPEAEKGEEEESEGEEEEEGEEEKEEEEGQASGLHFTDDTTVPRKRRLVIPGLPPKDSRKEETVQPAAKKQRRPQVQQSDSRKTRAGKTTSASASVKSTDMDASPALTPTWAGVPLTSFRRFPSDKVSQPVVKRGRGIKSSVRPPKVPKPKSKYRYSVKQTAVRGHDLDAQAADPEGPSQATQEGAGFRMGQMLQKLIGGPPLFMADQRQEAKAAQKPKPAQKIKKEGGKVNREEEQIADEEDDEEWRREGAGGVEMDASTPHPVNTSQRLTQQLLDGLPTANIGLANRIPRSHRGSVSLQKAVQRVLEHEKQLRNHHSKSATGASDVLDVRIDSKDLEGDIRKCTCVVLQQSKSWSKHGGGTFGAAAPPGHTTQPTVVQVWFDPKSYPNVDIEVGATVRIHAPWHEVHVGGRLCVLFCYLFATQLDIGL